MRTYKSRIIFRIMKGVSSLRWGTDAIPRLFDRISKFPHPRDALACFFFLCSGSPETEFQVCLSWNEHWRSAVCHVWRHFFFFLHSKKKILTLERGGEKKRKKNSVRWTGFWHRAITESLITSHTVSLCPPSFGLFIRSALIFMEAKINFIWYC